MQTPGRKSGWACLNCASKNRYPAAGFLLVNSAVSANPAVKSSTKINSYAAHLAFAYSPGLAFSRPAQSQPRSGPTARKPLGLIPDRVETN